MLAALGCAAAVPAADAIAAGSAWNLPNGGRCSAVYFCGTSAAQCLLQASREVQMTWLRHKMQALPLARHHFSLPYKHTACPQGPRDHTPPPRPFAMALLPRSDEFFSPYFLGFPDLTREFGRGQLLAPFQSGAQLETRGMPVDVVSGEGARAPAPPEEARLPEASPAQPGLPAS